MQEELDTLLARCWDDLSLWGQQLQHLWARAMALGLTQLCLIPGQRGAEPRACPAWPGCFWGHCQPAGGPADPRQCSQAFDSALMTKCLDYIEN